LAEYLDDLFTDFLIRWVRRLESSSSSTLQAIRSAADEHKFQILDRHFELWCSESINLITSVIRDLAAGWAKYEVRSSPREWLTEATNIIWKVIEHSPLRWMIGTLDVWPDATVWIAPDWLYGPLQPIRSASFDDWDATQKLLASICNRVQRRFSFAHEEALNAARRALRLASPARGREGPKQTIDDIGAGAETRSQLFRQPKGVREGKTVDALYEQLTKVRKLYRDNGLTALEIRTEMPDFTILWEWVDLLPEVQRRSFLSLTDWDDGADFIYRQIATLYRYARRLSRTPSWTTIRNWRKQFRKSRKAQ
jgi:hypothetical protein